MPNPHRGEVAITIGDKEYVMRPTFEALVNMETRTGKSALTLSRELIESSILISEIAVILHEGIKAGENQDVPTYQKIAEDIMNVGIAEHNKCALDFMSSALMGRNRVKNLPNETGVV